MKLTDILEESSIVADLAASTKTEALESLVNAMVRTIPSLDTQEMLRVLLEREELGSTGIGDGIAIPHGKSQEIRDIDGIHRRKHLTHRLKILPE